MVENLIAISEDATLFSSGLCILCVFSSRLSSLSWLSNGGLDGQFDHDLIEMAYDLTEVFDSFSCFVSLWRGLWLR